MFRWECECGFVASTPDEQSRHLREAHTACGHGAPACETCRQLLPEFTQRRAMKEIARRAPTLHLVAEWRRQAETEEDKSLAYALRHCAMQLALAISQESMLEPFK